MAAQADTDEGTKPGVSRSDSTELREARKRIKLLEQENEGPAARDRVSVAGEPAGKRLYPLVNELATDGIPSR
ncbi:hypothetical protein C8D87_103787 [Lentzea atacamensis]|uniref:Transposase n=1 Tax=Lentzea atacamensis TaxID=531938 RepID=A0ABX9EBS8_9PSEU|nr:hypothetical protein [Lentzea atacamensis]RAS67448.1 hypothetical protein C8D87_103787 [Lentzea atacamensis]